MEKTLRDEFYEALRLLWFFLPAEEPCSPHSTRKDSIERNRRWNAACELYQKYAGQLAKEANEKEYVR
jgi:hypothetical protein